MTPFTKTPKALQKSIKAPEIPGRETCLRCRRAKSVCICGKVKVFHLDPLLILLIHPKESRKRIGTARLVKLSVANSLAWIGEGPDFDRNPELLEILGSRSHFPMVLFPGPDSLNVSRLPAQALRERIPPDRRLAILLVDGSWSLAKKMIQRSQVLRRLPRISFDVDHPSSYRFRRQPQPFCLSTVEAVHLLIENLQDKGLCALPPGRPHDGMLEIFDEMVETQLRLQSGSQRLPKRDSS